MAGPARLIKGILGIQLGMAAILFGHDLAQGWPSLSFAPRPPGMTEPVRPGDQTRLYRPGQRPDLPDRPGVPMPDSTDMPDRLSLIPETEDGARVLNLRGVIDIGDAERLADALERDDIDIARLDSPGGSVADALVIGRMLRAAGIGTEVPAGAICLSACPYVLAGGVTRQVATEAMVGVHQHYFGENTVLPAFLAVEDIQRGQGEVMGYLDDMGIDLRLMRPALATPPDEIYILVREELERYGLVTSAE